MLRASRLRWRRKRWDDSAYTDTYADSNAYADSDTYAGCPDF
ncbi:hypothetical protein NW855_07810 [Synechococcus sp. RC10B2]